MANSGDETAKRIRAALEADHDINLHSHPIRITVDDQVRLAGEVADVRAKHKAVRLARQTAGRDDVLDELTVERGEVRGVRALRQAAIATLQAESALAEVMIVEGREAPAESGRRGWIAVDVEDARIVLTGVLDGQVQRRLAEALCWWLPGAGDVVSRIHVEPSEPETDAGLASAIEVALEKDPSVNADQIAIGARDGVVRLEGVVDNEERARLAELDCWCVPGVHDVDNALTVQTAP